jgi:hypothetical protein
MQLRSNKSYLTLLRAIWSLFLHVFGHDSPYIAKMRGCAETSRAEVGSMNIAPRDAYPWSRTARFARLSID